jgi:hypothetical protein
MKEGVLFCSYEIHCIGMLQIVFLMSFESSQWGGVHGLGSMMFGLGVQIPLNPAHRDLSDNTKGTSQFLWNFQLRFNLIFSEEIIQHFGAFLV